MSRRSRMMASMKRQICLFAFVLACVGCVQQSPQFSWYHPQGGEYLFAYDEGECASHVQNQGLALGIDPQGPFFECMRGRGYTLLDNGADAFGTAGARVNLSSSGGQ